MYLYLLIGVTDFPIYDPEIRKFSGWALLATVFFSIFVNFAKTIVLTAMACKKKRI